MAEEDVGAVESQTPQDGGETPPATGTQAQPPGDNWREQFLTEELRGEKSLQDFKDINSMAKSHVELHRMLGNRVKLPDDNSTPEEWNKFYAKIGRPESPEGYDLADPGDMPPGMQWDQDLAGWFSKTAYELGLPKQKAQEFVKRWNDRAGVTMHEAQKQMGAELDNLRREWGDSFDGRVELGVRAIERAFQKPEEAVKFKEFLNTSGLGNHPMMIKFADFVGRIMKNDGYIVSDGKGGMLGTEAAKAKISEINADMKHPYWDAKHPGHAAALEEMKNLFRVAAGG